MFDMAGGRKIILGILLVAVGVAVDSFSKNGLSRNLLELIQYIGMGFFLGNGVEHIAKAVASRGQAVAGVEEEEQQANPPKTEPIQASPYEAITLSEIMGKVVEVENKVDLTQKTLLAIMKYYNIAP